MKLYEITEAYANLQGLLEDETIPVEVVEAALNEINEEFEVKAENIIKLMKSIEGEATIIREEEKRLAANRKVLENKADRLKEYLFNTMKIIDKKKIKTPLFTLNIAKNPASVTIDIDVEYLPLEYQVFETKANKKAILEAIKSGEIIEGCSLEQKESLRVK